MKENEAPEKIYLQPTKYGETYNHWSRLKLDETFVEYSRTDAFMKKAEKWLKSCLNNGMWIANDVEDREKEAIMEHFINYMGE